MKHTRISPFAITALLLVVAAAAALWWHDTAWRRAPVDLRDCLVCTANNYWIEDANGEAHALREEGGRFYWIHRNYGCWWTPAADLHAPLNRLMGYETAAERWGWADYDHWRSRWRLRRMLGRSFASRSEFWGWWLENRDYLQVSDEHLTIDEAAKAAKRPTYPHDPDVEITAREYWGGVAWGVVREAGSDAQYVRGRIFRGENLNPRFHIARTALLDAEARRLGYLDAVDRWVAWVREGGDKPPDSIVTVMERLTGRNFATAAELLQWWSENRAQLQVDDTGRLVPRPSKTPRKGT